ncbi:MAG: glycosyltransferase [Vicinamibacterales bacterium]
MDVEPVAPEQRLRIAVLGDFDGVHTRSWLRWFVERGHEVHAISYYAPAAPLDGVRLHVLRARRQSADGKRQRSGQQTADGKRGGGRVPGSLMRLAHGVRYWFAGLRRVLREIRPDVFHAHYVVEHGFYGALAGYHPYVVTAWGSDVLVEPGRDVVSKLIAKWTVRRADLVTSNNTYMADRIVALGAPRSKVEIVTLGADRYFLDRSGASVNVLPAVPARAPVVLSTRAHEPLYNIGEIVGAYEQAVRSVPGARLVVAHGGSQSAELSRRAAVSAGRIEFIGFVGREALRDAMTGADVFVSVPSSDGTSVALLQAMAAGCFPIVSDLPTQRELIDDGVNGFRVPLHRPDVLAERIKQALADDELRRTAAARNRLIVEERGLNEKQMAKMEALYWALVRARGDGR